MLAAEQLLPDFRTPLYSIFHRNLLMPHMHFEQKLFMIEGIGLEGQQFILNDMGWRKIGRAHV